MSQLNQTGISGTLGTCAFCNELFNDQNGCRITLIPVKPHMVRPSSRLILLELCKCSKGIDALEYINAFFRKYGDGIIITPMYTVNSTRLCGRYDIAFRRENSENGLFIVGSLIGCRRFDLSRGHKIVLKSILTFSSFPHDSIVSHQHTRTLYTQCMYIYNSHSYSIFSTHIDTSSKRSAYAYHNYTTVFHSCLFYLLIYI